MMNIALGKMHGQEEGGAEPVQQEIDIAGTEVGGNTGLVQVRGKERAFADEKGYTLQETGNFLQVFFGEGDIGNVTDTRRRLVLADTLVQIYGIVDLIFHNFSILLTENVQRLSRAEPVIEKLFQLSEPWSLYKPGLSDFLLINQKRVAFGDPEYENRNFVVAEISLDLEKIVSVNHSVFTGPFLLEPAGETLRTGEKEG
jgi:hypothetical protein